MLKFVLAFLLASSQCLLAQGFVRPGQLPPKSQWPPALVDRFGITGDAIILALTRRVGNITDFQFPDLNVGWSFKIMRLDEDTFILDYMPPSGPNFSIQAITCSTQKTFIDSSILGPTETASDFYDANLHFLLSYSDNDNRNYVLCGEEAHLMGKISSNTTEIPDIEYVTSEDRAMRHVCAWLEYFLSEKGNNVQRAADFLVTALDKEGDYLRELDSDKSYTELVAALDLFDKQFPADGFDRARSLGPDVKTHVRSYFETTVQLRKKLAPFIPNAETRIAKDEALLATFR